MNDIEFEKIEGLTILPVFFRVCPSKVVVKCLEREAIP